MTLESFFRTVDKRLARIAEVRRTMDDLPSERLQRVVETYSFTWKMRDFLTEVFGGQIPSSAVYYRAAREELRSRNGRNHHTLY